MSCRASPTGGVLPRCMHDYGHARREECTTRRMQRPRPHCSERHSNNRHCAALFTLWRFAEALHPRPHTPVTSGGRGSRRAANYARRRLGCRTTASAACPTRQPPREGEAPAEPRITHDVALAAEPPPLPPPPHARHLGRARLPPSRELRTTSSRLPNHRRVLPPTRQSPREGEAPAEPRTTHDVASAAVRQEPHPPVAAFPNPARKAPFAVTQRRFSGGCMGRSGSRLLPHTPATSGGRGSRRAANYVRRRLGCGSAGASPSRRRIPKSRSPGRYRSPSRNGDFWAAAWDVQAPAAPPRPPLVRFPRKPINIDTAIIRTNSIQELLDPHMSFASKFPLTESTT